MHELAVCQAMLEQVADIGSREQASEITRIVVRIGPLSGIVPELLEQAFSIARAGTIANQAELITESTGIRVRCSQCGAETDAGINRMICGECGDYRTQLLSGDELLLASVELNRAESAHE
ncbi:MAG: hydrogenase maturation nickel metallochaperone HypA [Chromatiales bacterium]|nr:hydrogenase maturation nickel metallochaperone HypA [Gammaproteobacteria bacterium]